MTIPQTQTAAIVAKGLTRRFGQTIAVDSLDLTVASGSVTGVLGPNGAGKSTFLRMLVGLVRPSGGTAVVAGVTLRGDGTEIRKRVSFAPGEIAMYGEMHAHEQLDWLLRGRGDEAKQRGRLLTTRLGLPLDKRIHEYSHGMKRQLLFASAMASPAKLRILDEPTEGLDPAKRSQVLEMMSQDVAAGGTILLSSHHLSEVEEVCERMVFFSGGKLLADESAADLKQLAARCAQLEFATEDQAGQAAKHFEGNSNVARVDLLRSDVMLEFATGFSFSDQLAELQKLSNPPIALEVGHLSLEQLYERLYGVRGL